MARLVFSDANLLDGDSPARPGQCVVVDSSRGRIESIARETAELRPGDRHIDLAGRTLMPGLVTTHFHSTYDNITIQPMPLGLETPPGVLTLIGARHLRWALESGFTSVVSAGGINDDIDPQLKIAIDEGIIPGPRFVPGGRGLDTTGGYLDTESWWWELGSRGSQRFCDGVDEFIRAVRDECSKGVEMVKLFPSGGHGVDEEIEEMSFTREELRACVDTAHARGARVRAHCAWKDAMHECLDAGVDILDHGDRLDEALLEKMLARDTALVPSMYLLKRMIGDSANAIAATDVQRAPMVDDYANIRAMVPIANQAGLRLCIGDDYGIIVLPHGIGAYNQELEFYVKEVGIPPLDVIRWATKHGGSLVDPELGLVREGWHADLLVVEGDPSQDISVLCDVENIQAIVRAGELFKDELPAADGNGADVS